MQDQFKQPHEYPWYQRTLSLVYDYHRTNQYNQFLKENAKDKIVVECGAGSGVLSWLAMRHGAKEVTALDIESGVLDHLSKLSAKYPNFKSGYSNVIVDQFPEADLYMHELLGSHPLDDSLLSFAYNCKQQGISLDNVYPNTISLYEYTDLEKSLRWLVPSDYDSFAFNDFDPEVLEFLEVTKDIHADLDEREYFGCCLRYFDVSYSDRKKIWEGDLYDMLKCDWPKAAKGTHISYDLGFDYKHVIDLIKCDVSNWQVSMSDKFYNRATLKSYKMLAQTITNKPAGEFTAGTEFPESIATFNDIKFKHLN